MNGTLTYEGRNLFLLPVISKAEAKKQSRDNDKEVKKSKKKVTFEDLVKADKKKKKNCHLAKKGLYVTEDNVEVQSERETIKRKNHLIEKMLKMQNPNMKISSTKILLKNVNKLLEKQDYLSFSKNLLREEYQGNIETAKIFNRINVLRDE